MRYPHTLAESAHTDAPANRTSSASAMAPYRNFSGVARPAQIERQGRPCTRAKCPSCCSPQMTFCMQRHSNLPRQNDLFR
ncbi:hypothetical protein CI102_4820 [Trichoderma harzianum]|uniref:Uncharacterized protein n=1 Tax=Trichoderma harzianum CBS 226.95 TaxID=983964 RepID=A0A2T4AQ77_TRIHA|nr:hypothetical protein M431DRAFT_294794 [Trichoderma harzianum CBS 226.95]PKK50881.1 hypothetical protein CI102_4820 [Trichoderma harzianum]PTB59088.1 hypothetical protein M431DRAFT_294794 [Trichoderma harzianum CBS 226.95]